MNIGLRNASLRRLAYLAAGFVVLVCTAILVLSTLREWGLRHEALRAAEVDVANVAQSLLQHAEDSSNWPTAWSWASYTAWRRTAWAMTPS